MPITFVRVAFFRAASSRATRPAPTRTSSRRPRTSSSGSRRDRRARRRASNVSGRRVKLAYQSCGTRPAARSMRSMSVAVYTRIRCVRSCCAPSRPCHRCVTVLTPATASNSRSCTTRVPCASSRTSRAARSDRRGCRGGRSPAPKRPPGRKTPVIDSNALVLVVVVVTPHGREVEDGVEVGLVRDLPNVAVHESIATPASWAAARRRSRKSSDESRPTTSYPAAASRMAWRPIPHAASERTCRWIGEQRPERRDLDVGALGVGKAEQLEVQLVEVPGRPIR